MDNNILRFSEANFGDQRIFKINQGKQKAKVDNKYGSKNIQTQPLDSIFDPKNLASLNDNICLFASKKQLANKASKIITHNKNYMIFFIGLDMGDSLRSIQYLENEDALSVLALVKQAEEYYCPLKKAEIEDEIHSLIRRCISAVDMVKSQSTEKKMLICVELPNNQAQFNTYYPALETRINFINLIISLCKYRIFIGHKYMQTPQAYKYKIEILKEMGYVHSKLKDESDIIITEKSIE